MKKKNNANRKQSLAKKSAVEALRFQTHFGLKQRGLEEGNLLQKLADAEIDFIAELDLAEDILDIKKMIEGIKVCLSVEPTTGKGDLCTSITAIALKIASIPCLGNLEMPVSWQDQVNKKLLAIYFPDEKRNEVVEWAKANGYNTSTYLGQPIVKFRQLYIIIERTRT